MLDYFFEISTAHRHGVAAPEDILIAKNYYTLLLEANKSSNDHSHANELERYQLEAVIDWFDIETSQEVTR